MTDWAWVRCRLSLTAGPATAAAEPQASLAAQAAERAALAARLELAAERAALAARLGPEAERAALAARLEPAEVQAAAVLVDPEPAADREAAQRVLR